MRLLTRKSWSYQRIYGVWRKYDPPNQPVRWLFYRLVLTSPSQNTSKSQWEVELCDDKGDIYFYYFDTRKSAHEWIKIMGEN